MDAIDRAAADYNTAIDDCIAQGGRLASTRQLTEMIRAGLPNGSTNGLWTSDASGNNSNGFAYATILNWNGVDTGFAPISPANANWSAKGTITNAYRCIWSNELW